MLLKIKRSQRTAGIVSSKQMFILDARVELTGQEEDDVAKYKLGKTVIYNSEASKKHIEAGATAAMSGSGVGLAKSIVSFTMARLNLNISIDGLTKGTHVECKDLEELLGAEQAIMSACENLKMFLSTAATFDGREVLVDFSHAEARAVQPRADMPRIEGPRRDATTIETPSAAMALASEPATHSNSMHRSSPAGEGLLQEWGEFPAKAMAFWHGLSRGGKLAAIAGGIFLVLYLFG